MNILYNAKIDIQADLDSVWEALTSSTQRAQWHNGIEEARHIAGDQGYRGAQTELILGDGNNRVVEHIKRSRPLERLQLQFEIGNCRYVQYIYLSQLNYEHIRLTYYCKQFLISSWRSALKIRPAAPRCLDPIAFDSLNKHLSRFCAPSNHIFVCKISRAPSRANLTSLAPA